MSEYLIVDPNDYLIAVVDNSLSYTNGILGTIIARSKSAAIKKAIKLTGVENPIVINYTNLDDSELEIAELAPILNIPNSVGRPSSGHRRSATLTGLSDKAAYQLDNVENRSAYLVGLIEQDLKANISRGYLASKTQTQ
jgi:hypothetical protein